jgi:hypothetical protein
MGLGIRSHHLQESHTPIRSGSLDFHQVIPNLVPMAGGTVCQAHTAFEVFDNSDQNLTHFVVLMVSHRCDYFLKPWPRSIEPKLT